MSKRLPASILLVLLAAGFGYSGPATVRLYRELFQTPRSAGPSATIDAYLAPLRIGSATELREAAARAKWPGDADASLVAAEPPVLSAQEIGQVHFALSYALYPTRIWLRSAPDVRFTTSEPKERHVLVIGDANPFEQGMAHRISDRLWLVELP